jgi:hypothetical protein
VPPPQVVLLPDAGPLITLAYADALDLLLRPGWSLQLVDMVLHEVTRNQTPTSEKIRRWADALPELHILPTRTFRRYQEAQAEGNTRLKKTNLGELAIQESMNEFALAEPPATSVFLFEDHKIARASFLLPDNCRKISTRAYLLFLEQRGLLDAAQTAASVERTAIRNGRNFSQLRFPPG